MTYVIMGTEDVADELHPFRQGIVVTLPAESDVLARLREVRRKVMSELAVFDAPIEAVEAESEKP